MFLESGSFKIVYLDTFECSSWKQVCRELNAAQNPQEICNVKATNLVLTFWKIRRSGDENDQRNGDTRMCN